MGTHKVGGQPFCFRRLRMVCMRRIPSLLAGPVGLLAAFWVASGCVPDVPFPRPDAGAGPQNAQAGASTGLPNQMPRHPTASNDDPAATADAGLENAGMSAKDSGAPETVGEGDWAGGPMMVSCDADLQTDINNCGACGRTCPKEYPRCEEGDCRAAPAHACSGANLDSDPNNCGRCAWTCDEGETCEGGKCVLSCSADLASDSRNCGACGLSCDAGRECRDGECRVIEVPGTTCPDDRQTCGMLCIENHACCDDLSCRVDDVAKPYCDRGVCIECKLAMDCDSDERCNAGHCEPKPVPCGGGCGPAEQCSEDRCVCPGNPDLDTDRGNCGTCGNRCEERHECVKGVCQMPQACGGTCSDVLRCAGESCVEPISLAAGTSHTCGLSQEGMPICWGLDEDGRLNAATGAYVALSAGASHTCGIRKSDGRAVCWGSALDGRLAAPDVALLALSAGGAHACGVRADNRELVCWGDLPGSIQPPPGRFQAVAAGAFYTCAIRADDQRLECWGNNPISLFPDDQVIPTPGGEFASVSVGGSNACGIRKADRKVLG